MNEQGQVESICYHVSGLLNNTSKLGVHLVFDSFKRRIFIGVFTFQNGGFNGIKDFSFVHTVRSKIRAHNSSLTRAVMRSGTNLENRNHVP